VHVPPAAVGEKHFSGGEALYRGPGPQIQHDIAPDPFTVHVINRAPELSPIGDQIIYENQLFTLQVTATDPDDTIPTLMASNLPEGASFTDNGDGTGTFTWTPAYDQAGTYAGIHFEAIDAYNKELTDSEDITITVVKVYHDLDYWPPESNWEFEIFELMRAIQFFNMGGYHADDAGEDGFAAAPPPPESPPPANERERHDADYWPTHGKPGPDNREGDWVINLSELLRLFQLYNVGGYHRDPDSEDGFAPGKPAKSSRRPSANGVLRTARHWGQKGICLRRTRPELMLSSRCA